MMDTQHSDVGINQYKSIIFEVENYGYGIKSVPRQKNLVGQIVF